MNNHANHGGDMPRNSMTVPQIPLTQQGLAMNLASPTLMIATLDTSSLSPQINKNSQKTNTTNACLANVTMILLLLNRQIIKNI